MKKLKKFFNWLVAITPFKVTLTIVTFFILASFLNDIGWDVPLVRMLDNKALDIKFSLRGIKKPNTKAVIVAIDEKSLSKLGQWPFDRAKVMAPLISKLCSYNPLVVGLDVMWPEAERNISAGIEHEIRSIAKSAGIESKIDQALASNSGDQAMQKAVENCGRLLVQGYTLLSEPLELDKAAKKAHETQLQQMIAANRVQFVVKTSKVNLPKNVKDLENPQSYETEFRRFGFDALINNMGMYLPESTHAYMNNYSESDDGNFRNYIPVMALNGEIMPSLALSMFTKTTINPETKAEAKIQVVIPDYSSSRSFSIKLKASNEELTLPVDKTGKLIVNYYGPNYMFPHVSLSDVLSDSETISFIPSHDTHMQTEEVPGEERKPQIFLKREFFKDSIILVGATAAGIFDIRPRPLAQNAYGVENQLTVIDNFASKNFLERPSAEVLLALLSILFVLGLIYGNIIARLSAKPGFAFAAATISSILYVDQIFLFNKHGIVFSAHLQAMQFMLQYVAVTIIKFVREEADKKFIRGAFDKFVSPDVIEQMIADPTKLKIGGEKKELSILFSDVAGFTELSERLEAKVLTLFLNDYLGAMTDIVQANGGTLDKYIGDAVMAFWGAPIENPRHADMAVKTAIEMQDKIKELNIKFKEKYGFEIEVRIGVNSGEVSVGNFGSSRVFEYTVIGDNVNLASRLEGVNKYYGTQIIVSEFTKNRLNSSGLVSREIDTIRVKGKHKPVKIFQIIASSSDVSIQKETLNDFQEGLTYYYGRHWEKALSYFEKILARNKSDKAAEEFAERCKHYLSTPPSLDWDGSWEMTSK